MTHFLLTYHPDEGDLHIEEFEDGARARRAFVKLERQHLDDEHVEVVLLGARSRAELEKTHGRYFRAQLTAAF
jgi:hypothetical protein